ncbi:unnamed protein product [Litomosoides sigmodontis]|uniref:Phospholipase B-like n=1 Tax=Litomosoides sigmodontis TaxID=42156 RepID=A0A3P6TTW5_LITSI|nr:unnamed protein product [Litomosoides sigmodontis]
MLLLLLLLIFLRSAQAEFTTHFRSFIHNNYGIAITQALERTDLGNNSSFGGKGSTEDELDNQAVILIHDSGDKIERFQRMVKHLLSKGYKQSEIYGTTWGDGGLTALALIDLKCSYVKQIRHGIFFTLIL